METDGYYNFWKDKEHPRGIWRRASLAEYRKPNPAWETLIDLDALDKAEKENWVWHGANCLKPEYRHCLILLSRGGADADVVREYDLKARAFVKDGFYLPEAKSQVDWIDADTLFVGTDFGPGSMTKSSYARIAKEWKRGTPLTSATTVYEGTADDLAIGAGHDATPGFERDLVTRSIDFFTSETFLRGAGGKLHRIEVPLDAIPDVHREWLLIKLRTPWTVNNHTYSGGSLLAARFDDFMAGKSNSVGALRAGRVDLAGQLQLDPAPPDPQRAQRRRQPDRGPDSPGGPVDARDARGCASPEHGGGLRHGIRITRMSTSSRSMAS